MQDLGRQGVGQQDSGRQSPGADGLGSGAPAAGRALVVAAIPRFESRQDEARQDRTREDRVDADQPARTLARYRADAAFLAHLLAVRAQVPSQRAKRRAAPEVGAAAYQTGLGLLACVPRRTLGIKA